MLLRKRISPIIIGGGAALTVELIVIVVVSPWESISPVVTSAKVTFSANPSTPSCLIDVSGVIVGGLSGAFFITVICSSRAGIGVLALGTYQPP